jgi:conjugative transfer region protein (TIGR03748 family)
MKQVIERVRLAIFAIAALLASIMSHAQGLTTTVDRSEVQVGRYTTLPAGPAPNESNPLAVIATVNFPRGHVYTVGDAIDYLLLRTGYRAVERDLLDTDVQNVMALPLPESHRRLGPYRVDAMLAVLLSKPYKLWINHLERTVSYVSPRPPAPASGPTSPPQSKTGALIFP